jgi:hypothetical protein
VGIPRPLFLDVEALRNIAGYAHWIPMIRGLYKEFFSLNYPGWEWNHIIPVLIKKGILKVHSKEIDQRYLAYGLSISIDIEGVTLWIKHGETEVAITRKTNQEGIEDRC